MTYLLAGLWVLIVVGILVDLDLIRARKAVWRMTADIIAMRDEAEAAKTQAIANLVKSAWLLDESERIKNSHAVGVRSWSVN